MCDLIPAVTRSTPVITDTPSRTLPKRGNRLTGGRNEGMRVPV
jgi:hypothetical protein